MRRRFGTLISDGQRPRFAIAPDSAETPPRATLIVPTLNEERVLGTFLQQLRPLADELHLELIVSDGGSEDRTQEIAGSWADQVVAHSGPERQTIAAGRNAGAAASRAPVLVFLNADVTLPHDAGRFINELIMAAERHVGATCRVAVAPRERTVADAVILGGCNVVFWATNQVGIGMGRGECHAVRRAVFEAVGGYNAGLAAGEDFELFKRLAQYGRATRQRGPTLLWHWVVYESPRRYRKLGYPRTLFLWARNAWSVSVAGRSHSREWEAVR